MPRSTPQYWMVRFLIGIACILGVGFGIIQRVLRIGDPVGLVSIVFGAVGFFLAYTSITPLVRFATLTARTRRAWSDAAHEAYARASLPRRIYYLLAAVAEADGPMSTAERQTVRHFLLERFLDPVMNEEIRSWEEKPLQFTDRIGLAARIAAGLDATERDSLFCWCCLVAFADGRFRDSTHAVLQEVSKGLGIAPARARMLFHLARAQYLRGEKQGSATRPAQAMDRRAQALAVLGLPADANPGQIRARHRQLVRKFHPDTQAKLGPVAQREATERFTEIQRAYETLTTS
ncbi:MAG TPA: TerB family tellurite resistance protein [Planctomycetota bacterium]